MGKKQHQKDKLYITNKEWREEWGGKRAESGNHLKFRRLPFNCCSLTFQPFEHPLCTKDGIIFDLLGIVPYLKKFGINPVNGEPLNVKNLTKLNFHKNSDGKMHCPITYKVFTENSHIVAIKTTGNVYSFEAVEKLNLKPGNFKDLLTDEEFTRKDIITVQNPTSLDKFNISNFHHVKNKIKLVNEKDEKAKIDPMYTIRKANSETESILSELAKTHNEKKATKTASSRNDSDDKMSNTAAHYSTGAMASSFTSTSIMPQTEQKAATIDKDTIRYSKIKSKAYVRMQTSVGDLNFELHCDQIPRTCENFLGLCKKGYYDKTKFHRLIKNFMIQGGDPTGTGHGGESLWGEPFKDEFKANLVHKGRGILSMANSGENTNKSQFFISFRSCRHLDNKHAVFGRVVGGMDTLRAMEEIKTDASDKPLETITILRTTIFVDPYEEADKLIAAESAEKGSAAVSSKESRSFQTNKADPVLKPQVHGVGIGKYISPRNSKRTQSDGEHDEDAQTKSKAKKYSHFNNFSSW